MSSTEYPLNLIISGRLTKQVIAIEKFPTTIGRSPDCDITLDDRTVAPQQLAIDCNDDGKIVIEEKAQKNDNPTLIKIGLRGKKFTQTAIAKHLPLRLKVGRLQLTLSYGKQTLEKTIQLHPPGLLGLFSSMWFAVLLLLVFFGVSIYESYLDSIEPFEPRYNDYFKLTTGLFVMLGYTVFINVMRSRFSLVTFSLSLLCLSFTLYRLLPFITAQGEYWLNINSDTLLFQGIYILLTLVIWFLALRRKLHLTWRAANTHALLISLPMIINTLSDSVIRHIDKHNHYITGNFNGQLEPYNWHAEQTQSLEDYFKAANAKLVDETMPSEPAYSEK